VVAVHDKDGMLGCIDVVRELRERIELPIRIRHSIPANRMDEPGADYVKAFMDGTLGSRTARLIGGGGVEVTSRVAFEQIVRDAAALGLPTAVHAIGDQAVRDALDAFEASRDAWAGLRQRIEHAQCVHPDDRARFAALDITASIQPAMAVTDEAMAERIWADRIERAYAYGSLHRAGARLAGGSDAPVEALDPLAGIRAAVLRTWRPAEALDLDTVLHAWTTVPAYLESRTGHLAPGTLADLTILDRDPYTDLAGATVIGTISGGRWTYRGF
jgi:predicted amidohydrolase YtcJ